MGINIIDEQIVGEISFLEEKLEGKIPVAREDLIVLINSWGRTNYIYIDVIGYAEIDNCEPKECYDLSKLDVSRIKNMDDVFMYSLFEGDISQWNTSNVTSMDSMFSGTTKFNNDISNWNISKVIDIYGMFNGATKFNQNISNWCLDNVLDCQFMLDNAKAFLDKYNSNEPFPTNTNEIKDWFNLNRERMNMISIKDQHGDEIDEFFSLLKECNDQLIYFKNLDSTKK